MRVTTDLCQAPLLGRVGADSGRCASVQGGRRLRDDLWMLHTRVDSLRTDWYGDQASRARLAAGNLRLRDGVGSLAGTEREEERETGEAATEEVRAG